VIENNVNLKPQRAGTARRLWARAVLCVAALAVCLPAAAFYPIGGWDSFGTLRYAKWKLSDFDGNNDGIVGPGEGREVQIEGGKSGFTAAEILTLQKSMNTWQSVPSTYASFRVRGIFQDVLLPGSGLDNLDTVSSFYMQVTEDDDTGEDVIPDPVILDEVSFPVLGVTLILFSVEEVTVQITGGQIITIPAGTIIDSDVIINASATRAIGSSTPLVDLEGVMTHELGHFLGLDHPAHSNLRPEAGPLGGLVESPVLPYTTGNDGIQRIIGVTPTMFPFYFLVQNDQGARIAGGRDLAPDDISGISFLYPRGSQAAFFDVAQNARTQSSNSAIPSVPILGGHVVAWADEDGSPDTPRVPVFGTMTGLYEKSGNPGLEGRFNVQGLWKQFEVQGAANIFRTPSYVFTLSPLSGAYPDAEESYIRQMPVGITPVAIDSLHNPATSSDTRSADSYITAFASEVFQETENILDVSNRDAGTGMVWSFEQNTLVSTATGKTLPTILGSNKPMFGDPSDLCPLFVTELPTGGGGTGGGGFAVLGSLGNDRLRAFRDNVLLRSAVGTALVNSYYRVAPSITGYLLAHESAFYTFRYTKLGIYWVMENFVLVLGMIGALGVATLALRRRRSTMVAATVLLVLLGGLAHEARAVQVYQEVGDFVAGASDIVTGRVLEATARWGQQNRIFTDVTVEISGTAKGNASKANSTITFSVIGGKIDGLAMVASEMPTFKVGEDTVIYLREYKPGKYVVYGGTRGKVSVSTAGEAKLVRVAPDILEGVAEQKAAKGTDKTAPDLPEGTVTLSDYMDFIRSLAAEQEANAAK